MNTPTIAIAHDYLTQRGGAERVVLAMSRAFPEAVIYTTLYDPEGTYPDFASATIRTSWLNRFGVFRRDHRKALPLLALASDTLRVDADIVVVSTSGWAHAFPTRGRRFVYCHSPARWLYLTKTYLGGSALRSVKGVVLLALRPLLRRWDLKRARAAGTYVANSRVIRTRIRECYGIEAEVFPAPHSFDPSLPAEPIAELAGREGYYLVVSRLLPYKNVTEVVRAFRGIPQHRLVIIGDGPLRDELLAGCPPNVTMLRGLSDGQMRYAYRNCRALIAPSIEDYGLTPIEAGAFGKPTLALRAGGYLDTVAEGVSGAFFEAPTPEAIAEAVAADHHDWDATAIIDHIDQFSEARFIQRLRDEVAKLANR
ncbi:MAG: glycosyltransferase [Propionibacteriaceae bacterium]|nr:glycosyltransferase [Propionibacteriaceae bacterium]